MNSADFFHMGGYGLYVWGSYGVALAVLALNVALAHQHQRRVLRTITRSARRDRSCA
ncbi:MAG: heme exporter protein CcmD [Proteobacteria bacterium]|nr:heme exporter protein CcmD [Pseudomonadota bacterium]